MSHLLWCLFEKVSPDHTRSRGACILILKNGGQLFSLAIERVSTKGAKMSFTKEDRGTKKQDTIKLGDQQFPYTLAFGDNLW